MVDEVPNTEPQAGEPEPAAAPAADSSARPSFLPAPGTQTTVPGSPRPSDTPPPAESGRQPSRRSWYLLITGITAVLVLIAFVGAVVVMRAGQIRPATSPPNAAPARPRPPLDAIPGLARPDPHPTKLRTFRGNATATAGRVEDRMARLSYSRFGHPWHSGTLDPGFSAGQYFITENYPGGQWEASIMSGRLDHRLAARYDGPQRSFHAALAESRHVQGQYYPPGHRSEEIASQPLRVDHHAGWLTAAKLHFHQAGLKATSETMVIVAVDTGPHGTDPAFLYISVPNTAAKKLPDVTRVIKSLRVVH